MKVRVAGWLSLIICLDVCSAAEIFENFPQVIDPGGRYVFYSHGLIVEGDDPEPIHPEFGTYHFPAIKRALFGDGEFNLIAHHRPAATDVTAYVDQFESWINSLLSAGVAANRITLVGFSRGAGLTAATAGRLKDTGINTALLAVCLDGRIAGAPETKLGGHLLSIYEETDVVKSCAGLAQDSPQLASFREVAINTGRRHGAFYTPLPEWLEPLRTWIAETNR